MARFKWKTLINENSLVFSSMEFLFWFLPVFLIVFYLTPRKFRKDILFVGSILLYACCEPFYVFLLLAMTGLNFLIGRFLEPEETRIEAAEEEWALSGMRKGWLLLILLVDLGVLVFFKIGNVMNRNLLLPLGLSFYSFKMISYQIDVYRGNIRAERKFMRLGAYLCMFAQITSGPVMRMEDARQGLLGKKISLENVEEGVRLLVLGLASKVLLANQLGTIWNEIQTIGFESISTPLAWFGAFAYSLQLYFDFQGYSLMAVGIGMMMGFPFIKNFDQPYMATSVAGFWRRWHMTLGGWFRDYVYIPLGGNRKGTVRMVLNLAVVWSLTGLWHGNSLNFLIWGLALGFLVIAEKLFYGRWLAERKVFSHIYVWVMIPLTWVIFAVEDVSQLGIYFGRLFPFFGIGETLNSGEIFRYFALYWKLMLAAVLACVPRLAMFYEKKKRKWYMTLLLFILFWAAVYQLANAVNNPFMYFRF